MRRNRPDDLAKALGIARQQIGLISPSHAFDIAEKMGIDIRVRPVLEARVMQYSYFSVQASDGSVTYYLVSANAIYNLAYLIFDPIRGISTEEEQQAFRRAKEANIILPETSLPPGMYIPEIGKPFSLNHRQWPDGLCEYDCSINPLGGFLHTMRCCWAYPPQPVMMAWNRTPVQLGLVVYKSVISLLLQMKGAYSWSDLPFSIWRLPEHRRVIPPVQEDTGAKLQILLVESMTDILLARRVITMSPDFSNALHKAIADQTTKPYSREVHEAEIAELHRRYSDSAKMLEIATATCVGED